MRMKQQLPDMFGKNIPKALNDAYTAALIMLQGRAWAYYSVLINSTVVWTDGCPTAGTDGGYVYMNPNFFMGLPTIGQRAFLLAHEVGHIVLRHPMRGKFYAERGFHSIVNGVKTEWSHLDYNAAADYVINADLKAHGLEVIPVALMDDRFDRDALVDQVYITIMSEKPAQPPQPDEGNGDPQDQDESGESANTNSVGDSDDDEGTDETAEGSAADNSSDDEESKDSDESGNGESGDTADNSSEASGSGEPSADDEGDSGSATDSGAPSPTPHDGHDEHFSPQYDGTPEEQAEAEREDREEIERIVDAALDQLDDAIERGEKHIGASSPLSTAGYRHSTIGSHSDVNWHAELIEEITRQGTGGESTFAPINRRKFVIFGTVSPTELGTMDRLTLIIDVSGSVSRRALHQVLLETANAIDMMEPASGCLVLFTNTDVIDYHEVMTGQELLELDVPNCGGTYMTSALEWMEANGFDSDVTLCFTDGQMSQHDWNNCAANGVVMVLDRTPSYYVEQRINACGARVIVASECDLAA